MRSGRHAVGGHDHAGHGDLLCEDERRVRDGGVSAAAAGDTSIAAITSWSRLRRVVPGTCVVPLDGIAPSDATVGDLSYPEAFPVTYLRPRFAIDSYDRATAFPMRPRPSTPAERPRRLAVSG